MLDLLLAGFVRGLVWPTTAAKAALHGRWAPAAWLLLMVWPTGAFPALAMATLRWEAYARWVLLTFFAEGQAVGGAGELCFTGCPVCHLLYCPYKHLPACALPHIHTDCLYCVWPSQVAGADPVSCQRAAVSPPEQCSMMRPSSCALHVCPTLSPGIRTAISI